MILIQRIIASCLQVRRWRNLQSWGQCPPLPCATARQTVVEAPEESEQNNSWVIQLGSFRHQKNVKQLLDKLENAGYRAFSRPIETSSGPLTKVFVGPNLNKRELDGALSHLQELTGLRGKVTRFSVNS